jgi:hypothetical protein
MAATLPAVQAGVSSGPGFLDKIKEFIKPDETLDSNNPIFNWTFWIPTGGLEIAVFILFIIIFTFTLILFHYGEVQRRVAKSRCSLQSVNRASGIYTVNAINATNDKLYRIDYNLDAKTFSVECNCENGEIVNSFKNIYTYDVRSNTGKKSIKTIEKNCNCSKLLDSPIDTVYFEGDAGVVRFMNDQDISFFTESLK